MLEASVCESVEEVRELSVACLREDNEEHRHDPTPVPAATLGAAVTTSQTSP